MQYVICYPNLVFTFQWEKNCQYYVCQAWITSGTCWSVVTCNNIHKAFLGRRSRHMQLQLGFSIAFLLGLGNHFSSLNNFTHLHSKWVPGFYI